MTEEIDLWETRNCFCLAARRRAREITRRYEEKLRPHGLRATQFSILAALTLKGPTATGELASLLGLERTTLTRSARLMVQNGWVEYASSDDARQRQLRVTAAGKRKLVNAWSDWKSVQTAIGQGEFGAPHP